MKPTLAVLGAGGHAKMVIEAARSEAKYESIFCLAKAHVEESILGVPILDETESRLSALLAPNIRAFVAIGDNTQRAFLHRKLDRLGVKMATIVAKSACVSPSAEVGEGTVLMPHSVVGADAKVGKGVILNTSATVDHDCTIEAFVHVAPGVNLAGWVHVGQCALLGIGSRSLPSRKIGEDSILGAGAVLIHDLPDGETWAGCPASPIHRREVAVTPKLAC